MAENTCRKRSSGEEAEDAPDKKHNKSEPGSYSALREEYLQTTPWRGNVDAKLYSAAPYNFFLTRVKDVKETYDEDLSISFLEILDGSLGELEHSLHITYMLETCWLLAQYAVAGIQKPSLSLIYGEADDDLACLPNTGRINSYKVECEPYGHHHSKMSIYFYKDGSARIVITTANLVESDWENRTQGVWISPRLAPLPSNAGNDTGESVTFFKRDFLQYLHCYQMPQLENWFQRIARTDMSNITVCFISSVPGTHQDNSYGYRKLSELLREHCTTPHADSWSLVVQCSSIGSLGPSPKSWVCGPFGRALGGSKTEEVPVQVIYPSFKNVKGSLDGMLGGACLPYQSTVHSRQSWLQDQLWQWKSDKRLRSRAIPHIKTYAKLSPNGKHAAWFVLTSANLSKAAWGGPTQIGLRIRSYEAGVLFLPKFLTGEDAFRVKNVGNFEDNEDFPFPYDTPLTPYSSTDKIFLYDKCFR